MSGEKPTIVNIPKSEQEIVHYINQEGASSISKILKEANLKYSDSKIDIKYCLDQLKGDNFVTKRTNGSWALTKHGKQELITKKKEYDRYVAVESKIRNEQKKEGVGSELSSLHGQEDVNLNVDTSNEDELADQKALLKANAIEVPSQVKETVFTRDEISGSGRNSTHRPKMSLKSKNVRGTTPEIRIKSKRHVQQPSSNEKLSIPKKGNPNYSEVCLDHLAAYRLSIEKGDLPVISDYKRKVEVLELLAKFSPVSLSEVLQNIKEDLMFLSEDDQEGNQVANG
jgi:predicted transcriptional regulator